MIFHSRISENRIQSYITIACYVLIFHEGMQIVMQVLLHYHVLGREVVPMVAIYNKRLIVNRKLRLSYEARSGFP